MSSGIRHYYKSEGDILKYSSAIPNIIDDLGLSPEAVRLYLRFKRRVKQNNNGTIDRTAFDSTRQLANDCQMSPASVMRGKTELIEAGLIKVEFVPGGHGEFMRHDITVIDLPVWLVNQYYFSDDFMIYRGGEPLFTNADEAREEFRLGHGCGIQSEGDEHGLNPQEIRKKKRQNRKNKRQEWQAMKLRFFRDLVSGAEENGASFPSHLFQK